MSEVPGDRGEARSEGALTVLEVLRRTTEFLKGRGCDSPRLEAELLLGKGLGVSRLDLYLRFDQPLTEAELDACRELVRRRGAREPLAHVLGEKEFRSLAFAVGPGVLVPRPETETLVESALAFLEGQGDGPQLAADVGTGSGCVAIALAVARPALRIVATDVSARALSCAAANAARHGVAGRVQLVRGSYLDSVAPGTGFDAIVSNPPYVRPEERGSLPAELAHEPPEALFPPGGDFDEVYRALARDARTHLRPGGALFAETGESDGERVAALFEAEGLVGARRIRDLGGAERVVAAATPSA